MLDGKYRKGFHQLYEDLEITESSPGGAWHSTQNQRKRNHGPEGGYSR
jgi:hypothetical protein